MSIKPPTTREKDENKNIIQTENGSHEWNDIESDNFLTINVLLSISLTGILWTSDNSM